MLFPGARSWLGVCAARTRARASLLAAALVLLAAAHTGLTWAWDAQQMRAAAQRVGPGAVAALPHLQNLLNEGKAQEDASRLQLVNQFFNLRIEFRNDIDIWGQEDYWATPMQLLNAGRGDCEDYVIAKYTSLLAMGVSRQRLRLVYVRARMPDHQQPVAHMVLAYYANPGAEPLILDNLRGEVMPASQRSDLTPVFSFNSEGLWQGVGSATAGDPMARLSRWRDTWQRIQLEGFF